MSTVEKETIGLVIGKFMPLHNGHVELIKFALGHCDSLEVALVCKENDLIPMSRRREWLIEMFESILSSSDLCSDKRFKIVIIDEALPRTDGHTEEAFKVWTQYFKSTFSHVHLIISSEEYAEELAKIMGIKHLLFDKERKQTTVYASTILQFPEKYLDVVPVFVREYLLEIANEK